MYASSFSNQGFTSATSIGDYILGSIDITAADAVKLEINAPANYLTLSGKLLRISCAIRGATSATRGFNVIEGVAYAGIAKLVSDFAAPEIGYDDAKFIAPAAGEVVFASFKSYIANAGRSDTLTHLKIDQGGQGAANKYYSVEFPSSLNKLQNTQVNAGFTSTLGLTDGKTTTSVAGDCSEM